MESCDSCFIIVDQSQEEKRQLTAWNERLNYVLGNSVYNPTILLKGKWLLDPHFKTQYTINIICEDDWIIIKK